MYNNHDSILKHQTRLEVLDKAEEIINLHGSINALTLPSSNFIFENLLLKRNSGKVKLDCVEREKDIYDQLIKKFGHKHSVKFFRDEVFNYLQSTSERYNFMWLDLCGPLSMGTFKNVLDLIKSPALDDNSYLFVTLLTAREPEAKQLEEYYGTDMKTIRNHIFPNIVREHAGYVGRKCTIDPIIHYKSELKLAASPMNVYGFSFK